VVLVLPLRRNKLKITTKINLITTAWLLCVLAIINIIVFFSFLKITVDMEKNSLLQKSTDILDEIQTVSQPASLDEHLKNYLTNHSFIRMILPNGNLISEVTNDKKLTNKIKAKYSIHQVTKRQMIMAEGGEEQVLVVRVPITYGRYKHATLEIGERLLGLEMRKDILVSILGSCTILAGLLSLLGGRWLSNLIIRPISNMIKTMEDIEQSGVPKKIIIKNKTKDELEQIAITFNRMIEKISDSMEKQEQFISDASHELKTPLTVIKSYASLLRRRGIQNNEMSIEAIEAIYSEAIRIQKMTDMFLNMATTDNETILEMKAVDLISLSKGIQTQLKAAYKREITLHFNEEPIIICADELKLKQLIIILIDNAIKYSSDKVEVILEMDNQRVIIHIIDYGIGIPKEELERIFERFYRVDKARSRETGGTGLGLSIAKNIMKLHKGEIKINSKENKGTEVRLILPK
jgi:two-component system, OmpR family, sensor histidine kinase ArlS